MDSTTTGTTIAIQDLSLLSSPGKTVVQSKEKLLNMNSGTKRSSQLPRSRPTTADPGSKTTMSATKQTVQRVSSEASKLPSKYISKKNTSNDRDGVVNKTNEKNLTNLKNVSGGKPISSSKIHRNTALSKTRNPSKSACPKNPPSSECTSDNDSPALDELKVVTELNDKFRPRSDSESSHASHSSFCSQLSTSSVKSSICLPSANKSGLGKTKKTLTSSCSRLAMSRTETQMQKKPSMLSRTASSTTVTRASNSALSSVSKMSPDHQASRLRSRLGTENLQRAVSTGSLRNTNSKLSIPTGRSNLSTTANKTNAQLLKPKKVTNSTSDLSASNRALNKSGTKVPVRETTQTISTENLSVKHQNSLGKSCENLTKKPRSLLQASCENLSSKVRSNRSSALSNHTTDQKSSLLQSKKSSLSRSTSSSSSSLVQQREKSSSCASLAKDQRHAGFNGSTSSLPAAEKSDNKHLGNTRPGTGMERKATGIGGMQGGRTNPTDKSQLRRTVNVANKKATTSNAVDSVGKKKTLPRAPRNIGDQRSTSTTVTPTTKSSFGMKKSKLLENQSNKGVSKIPDKVSQNESPAKTSSSDDSNKTELSEGPEKSRAYEMLDPEEPCYKTNEISIENEEKLNEDNSLIKGKVSKNFAYDDYMLITDALSYENLSEPDVYNGDSDREDTVNHIRSPDKGLLRNNLSTSSLDISLHEDYVSDEGVIVTSVSNSDDHPYQQEQEEFFSKQASLASPSTACEKDVREKDQEVKCELSNHDVIKADVFSDKTFNSEVIYKSNLSTSAYHHHQQQHNKHHLLPSHHYHHHDHSQEFWSGLEEEREKKQGVTQREGKGIFGGPETDTLSVNDRKCVLAGKIKQGKEMEGEEDKEEEVEEKERGEAEDEEEVVPVVGLKSADIYRATGPGMPMSEFRPPHIGQHQHPQYITSRNEHTATGVGTGGSTSEEVTEFTTETAGTTVAGGKAVGTRRQLGGGYEKQNYPIHKTATTTTTQHRGGDKTGLLTQLVAGKEADSLDFELQSRLDVQPIASLVERTNVCDIDLQKMTDPLGVQSKQLKFGNYQTSLVSSVAENSCDTTEGDDADETENLSKEDLLMEEPASSDLVTRVRGPFLASEMGILGGQMLSPCSNDSSSFKDISDDVVTPLSDVQEVFDHDAQHSDEGDVDSNFEHNEEDDGKHVDTPVTGEESDSGSVLIEIEDSPLQVSVGNDEGEIIVEEQDYTSEERNYSDSNSSFVSDMIGERPIVDAGEDLAEVTLDGNETQNLWLAIEAESQYDNMSTCMTLENIAESSIGEDVEELFDQSPNVEMDNNSIGIPDKVPNKKLNFFKEIPSQEFDVDSPDLPDGVGSYIDDPNIMIEKNSVEMLNNTNEQELTPFDDYSTDKESLLYSSVHEICKPVDSLDENNPPRVADMTVDNFKSQVQKEMFVKTESQEGYLPDIDVNSNEDIQNGKCPFFDPVYHQTVDGNKQISCYNVSQEINLEDGNFTILKSDGSKKSKDTNAQDFTLRQLQGTLNLRKQRILELCGQTEGTPNKNQKPPPSPTKATENKVRPTSFKSADTLSASPQSSSLSPSPTRQEGSASINIPNSEMVQSSGSNSDGQSSPMKESWIKHEGKWKRCYVLDDGKCIPTEEYKEHVMKSPGSPNCEIIQNYSERYENQMNSDFDERSHPSERPANINVDELDQNLSYEEAPTPVARSFKDGPEKLLFNTNELMSESFADESMGDEQENEDTQVQESQAGDKTSSKKYDSVDGIQHDDHWTGENDSLKNKSLDVLEDVKDIQEPPSVECDSSRVQLELPLKSPTDPFVAEQKSFSPEIVDDIPFVDMDYTDSVVFPSSTDAQELHSPEIKDVKSLSGKEKQSLENTAPKRTILKDAMEVPCLENPCVKPFSGSISVATRPINLDVRPSVDMDVESSTGLNNVTQVNLDGLPPVDLDKVLINDSTDVSSVDLENEPSVEPHSSLVHLSKGHLVPTDVESISEQPGKQTEELNKPSHSENMKIEVPEKMPEELNKDQSHKTDVLSEEVDSNQPSESGIMLEQDDKCLPKMDIAPQDLGDENLKESVAGSQELINEFPEEMEILHHELDNEQPEECDTPPADYISNSFDGSGTRTPVNMQSVTPVGSVNALLDKSYIGQSSRINKRVELDRRDFKTQQMIRPSNFEREIRRSTKEAPPELLRTSDEYRTRRSELSALQAESELYKSDQDLTKVGSLCEEIFSLIGSPSLLHESWKTISSESSYEDASDMSSSQMESDDGNNWYSSRFSGGSSIYRNKSGSRSIYANIIRSSIHENSDSESSDYQESSMMTKSAQDYENLKRTKEKANNNLKGRGYWSDENSPDSILSSMDLYSDASEFAHACWSDRSTFGDATYQYALPFKYRGDTSVFGVSENFDGLTKSAYAMKPEESHDIKLLAEISELDETFGDSSHSDCIPSGRISDPTLRSSLTPGEGYWSPVSSPPTRKPYRRSLSLPFATRDGEGGRAALIKADLEKVNAGALGSPPELPSKVGRSHRKHNTVRRFSTQQSLSSDSNRERYLTSSLDNHGCYKASEDLSPLHHSVAFAAGREETSNGSSADYKTVKKTTDRPASLDEVQLRAQFLDLRLKGYHACDVTTDKYNGRVDPSGSDHLQESFLHDPESGAMIQPGDDLSFLPPKSPGILRRMFRRGRSFSEKVKPLRPDEVMGPPKDSFVRKMSMKAIFRRSRSGSNSSQKGKEFDSFGSDGRVESEVNYRLSREMLEKGGENQSVPSTPVSDEGCLMSNYSSVSMISSTGSTPPTSPAAGYSVTFATEGPKDDVFEAEDSLSLVHDKNYNSKLLSLQILRKSGRQPQHMLRGVPGGRATSESETYGAGCSGSNGTSAYFAVSDVHSNSQQPAPVSPQEMEKLSAIVRGEMVSSNSSDSGIQHDSSLQSSNESLKVLNWLKDRHTISLSKVVPECTSGIVHRKTSVSCRERPKSDINVRWAQLVEQVSTFPEPRRRLREPSESTAPKPRPKSDLGGSTLASDDMKELLIQGKLPHSQSQKTISEMRNSAYCMSKARRMSTPHPIKSRLTDRTAPAKLKKTLGRSFSMPENLNKIHKRRRLHPSGSDPLSDLHSHSTNDDSSDESEVSMDYSLPDKCHSTRTSQLGLAPVDEIFETENLTYAEALWDHVTMDPDELAFRAGDVIKVTDMLDKDWWWGILDDKEGWFPANFVRLRANQEHHLQEAQKTEGSDPNKDSSSNVGKSHQYSVNSEQARTNVINEIITAEREYVRQLDDVLQGYVVQAKKRPDMFPEEKTATIFGNLEDIYIFSKKFLKSVEVSLKDDLHQSEIGHCFIEHKKGFEIYSDYCNNHPHACDQLKELCKNKRYRHFFEGCRLLQEMKQIPLEGFLLTPVQKICKYPLQLAELLKYTSTEHPDYQDVCEALDAMKKIACLINERKRRMESIEKIAQWQATVEDWEGPDLLETSSELIYSGELSKVNSSGWTQERYFFLFDHQLIYCRKDLLKKNSFSFRGRIYLDHSKISQVADGRDAQFNVYVKNGWKLHDDKRNKSFLVFSKNAVEKDRWLKAFDEERRKVKSDQENGFTIPSNLRKSCVRNSFRKTQPDKPKEKLMKKNATMSFRYQQEIWKNLPAHATLPRGMTNPTTMLEGPPHPSGHKKRSWFSFTGKKSRR